MISLTYGHIQVEKANNGWVVQWKKLAPDPYNEKASPKPVQVTKIAVDVDLLDILKEAAKDISELGPYS